MALFSSLYPIVYGQLTGSALQIAAFPSHLREGISPVEIGRGMSWLVDICRGIALTYPAATPVRAVCLTEPAEIVFSWEHPRYASRSANGILILGGP